MCRADAGTLAIEFRQTNSGTQLIELVHEAIDSGAGCFPGFPSRRHSGLLKFSSETPMIFWSTRDVMVVHLHHDLAEGVTRADRTERIEETLERERTDRRNFDGAGFQPPDKVLHDAVVDFRLPLACLGAVHPNERRSFQQGKVHRQSRDRPGGESNDQLASPPSQSAERDRRDITPDRFEDDVDWSAGLSLKPAFYVNRSPCSR
jgi:hypothetical protein